MGALTLVVPPSLGAARSQARADLLRGSLSAELGREVVVSVPSSYAELRAKVLEPSVESAWAPAAVLAEMTAARAVLRAVRSGQSRYCSLLIARADRGVATSALHGRRAAWVDPLSVGGHLLAVSWLRAQGIEPNLTFTAQDFLGSHRDAVAAVLDGSHDLTAVSAASAADAEVQRALSLYAGAAADKLAVIGVTDTAPNDALVVTTRLGAAEAERVAMCLSPKKKGGRSPSFLLTAMEAERLEEGALGDYASLRSLLWGRRTERR